MDTWAWIALADSRDQAYAIATAERQRLFKLRHTFVTTDYVLNEAITRLYPQIGSIAAERYFTVLFQSVVARQLRLERVTPSRFELAWSMRRQFADKPDISFVDLTSMIVMKELGIQTIFTGDNHFRMVGLGFCIVPNHP